MWFTGFFLGFLDDLFLLASFSCFLGPSVGSGKVLALAMVWTGGFGGVSCSVRRGIQCVSKAHRGGFQHCETGMGLFVGLDVNTLLLQYKILFNQHPSLYFSLPDIRFLIMVPLSLDPDTRRDVFG
jgi:hypothetical protein